MVRPQAGPPGGTACGSEPLSCIEETVASILKPSATARRAGQASLAVGPGNLDKILGLPFSAQLQLGARTSFRNAPPE
jgi:hypothetical protein